MTARFAAAALMAVSLGAAVPAQAQQPVSMGMHVSVFQPPGTHLTTLMYGIYLQMGFDEHWSGMIEVLYANWQDSRGEHRWTTVPVSAIFQFLPGDPFNPYAIAGLNYTGVTDVTSAGTSARGQTGGHLGAGFVVNTRFVGFSLEGRYVLPDFKTPNKGYTTFGGGMSLGLGIGF